jgi:hypothetical protein
VKKKRRDVAIANRSDGHSYPDEENEGDLLLPGFGWCSIGLKQEDSNTTS